MSNHAKILDAEQTTQNRNSTYLINAENAYLLSGIFLPILYYKEIK